jgi:hypothetical protein
MQVGHPQQLDENQLKVRKPTTHSSSQSSLQRANAKPLAEAVVPPRESCNVDPLAGPRLARFVDPLWNWQSSASRGLASKRVGYLMMDFYVPRVGKVPSASSD